MIKKLEDRKTKLYKFLTAGKSARRAVKFDREIWEEAIEKLSEFNRAPYFFEFEDRLIDEIVTSVLRDPPHKAKREMMKIQGIVDSYVSHRPHCKPFLESIRTAVTGAVNVAMSCL